MEWKYNDQPVAYEASLAFMEHRIAEIYAHNAEECIWLLEHPAMLSAGTSAKSHDLLQPERFPVFASGRGGQYTYHGPGQRVGYVMLDLRKRGQDVRRFVWRIEEWLIAAFDEFSLKVERREGRIGLWVVDGSQEKKIAAVGLRIRKWVTFHGFCVNIDPNLDHYAAIVPCGLDPAQYGVTSMVEEGYGISEHDFDVALVKTFPMVFAE